MMLSKTLIGQKGAFASRSCEARAAPAGSTPVAPAPIPSATTMRDAQHREAHAAFNASLEKVVSAHRGTPVQHRESFVATLALQSSSAARLQRSTHLTTLNMASVEEEEGGAAASSGGLPLSQTAFKALLRASLAAARLHHGYLTTPHLLLGLISAGAPSLTNSAAAADRTSSSSDSLAAAAEAAVVALIDGPGAGAGSGGLVSGAGAAASLLGRSCGLDVVQWVHQLSGPVRQLLQGAEALRAEHGDALLTSKHLLAAMLAPHSSSSSVTHTLLQELGLEPGQVSAAVAAGLAGTAAGSTAGSTEEDVVPCEPLGFLHEEFYASLCAELRHPGAAATSSMPCMN